MKQQKTNPQSPDRSAIDRRAFLKLSGILASGLMLSHTAWAGTQKTGLSVAAQNTASPYLTPLFITEQASRLGQGSDFLQAGLKHCLNTDIHAIVPGNAFRLGSVMPFDKKELMPSLDKLKVQWNAGKQDQQTAQQLALLAGALAHQSAMAEIASAEIAAQEDHAQAESKIYQDATLISSYLTKGKGNGQEASRAMYSLFREMLPRTFTRFHTLMPDEADGGAWVMNLVQWRKQNDWYYSQLAEAIAQSDSGKVKKYISDTHFFDGNDTILKQVSPFERVANISREEADELIKSAVDGSACARALAGSYQTLIALSDYMAEKIDNDEMSSIMDKM